MLGPYARSEGGEGAGDELFEAVKPIYTFIWILTVFHWIAKGLEAWRKKRIEG
jgi:hypothetical protein